MGQEARYALGLDYGTSSCRALIVRLRDGAEVGTAVAPYPSGHEGVLLDSSDPNLARQHPTDWLHATKQAVMRALGDATCDPGFSTNRLVGIGVDTTGSTPLPVDAGCRPLAEVERFANDLSAMSWLWKDHTAYAEAEEITYTARNLGLPYLAKCGGAYSSEWFWAKILRCARVAPAVFDSARSWLEFADFIPAWLTGASDPTSTRRGICSAGHKAMYADEWGGLPSEEFLGQLDPRLADLRRRLFERAHTSDQAAGGLSATVAAHIGLAAGLPVAVGAMDAHLGAVGAGVAPGVMVKIMGTSTCDILVAEPGQRIADIPGVCGIVPGSVVPGMVGIEAGQSAVGDLFAWCADKLCPREFAGGDRHAILTAEAAKLRPGESGLLALDWNNGNRTVLVDPQLTGLLVGQTLHTTAPEIYRALIEATAFGAKTIVRRLEQYGVSVAQIVCCGGIAERSPLVMQIYADVLGRPMKLSRSGQTCALGAAIMGAVVGGAFPDVPSGQATLSGTRIEVFRPDPEATPVYAELAELYDRMHNAFGVGGTSLDLSDVMKRLIAIRQRARS